MNDSQLAAIREFRRNRGHKSLIFDVFLNHQKCTNWIDSILFANYIAIIAEISGLGAIKNLISITFDSLNIEKSYNL